MPQPAAFQDIFPILEQLEHTMEELYRVCAAQWPEDAEFWQNLEHQESKHAVYVKKAAELLQRSPGDFTAGRPFNQAGVQTMIRGIRETTAKVSAGILTSRKILFIVKDLEYSLLEKKYLEVVNSKNIEYVQLMTLVHDETATHHDAINKKISRLP